MQIVHKKTRLSETHKSVPRALDLLVTTKKEKKSRREKALRLKSDQFLSVFSSFCSSKGCSAFVLGSARGKKEVDERQA